MRLKLTFMLLAALLITACNDRTLEQLNKTNQELSRVKTERDSILNHLDTTLMALEKNMGIQDSEVSKNLTQRVRTDIMNLENMIKENEKKVVTLRSQNRISRSENKNLMAELESNQTELVKRQSILEDYIQQITRLDRKTKTQDSINSRLINLGDNQSKQMDELQRRLNTAYVIVGKFEELKNKKLVEKKGGFLHLFGRVPKLDPEYNRSLFATVNIRKDTIINLKMSEDQVKFITVHPSGSFRLIQTGENSSQLAIRDPDRFWEASNFLVIAEK